MGNLAPPLPPEYEGWITAAIAIIKDVADDKPGGTVADAQVLVDRAVELTRSFDRYSVGPRREILEKASNWLRFYRADAPEAKSRLIGVTDLLRSAL
jgi:hypothetical protein